MRRKFIFLSVKRTVEGIHSCIMYWYVHKYMFLCSVWKVANILIISNPWMHLINLDNNKLYLYSTSLNTQLQSASQVMGIHTRT